MSCRNPLRSFLALGLAIALPWIGIASAGAAPVDKTIRVGLLLSGFPAHYVHVERAFLAGMREIGYVEGRNLVVERRYAHLEPDSMRNAATELAEMKLDAIVTGCTGSTRAVQRATESTPIVMASVADPVGQGFVKSLAQPGTNVTGRSSQSRELLPKMLELLTTAVPNARTIAVLVNVLNTVHETLWTETVAAAASLDIDLVRVDVRGPAGLDAALETLAASRADALLVLPDDPMSHNLRAAHRRVRERARFADLVRISRVRRGGGADELRREIRGYLPVYRAVCRQGRARRETGGASDRAADTVRAGPQPRNGGRARNHLSAQTAAARGRDSQIAR